MPDHVIAVYLAVTNIIAIVMTIHDKNAAKRKKRRVPERTLLLTATLSGCIGMYLTMKIIHHKTKKMKFMIGIPVIFIVEVSVFLLMEYFLK